MKKSAVFGLVFGLAIHSAVAAETVKTIQVSGQDAKDLSAALVAAGAQYKTVTDASFLHVSSVKCHEEGGFAFFPMVCDFVDEVTATQKSSDGVALAALLTKLGVVAKEVNMGELHTVTLLMNSISCSNTALPSFMNCEITVATSGAFVERKAFSCTNGEEVNLDFIQTAPNLYRAEVTMQSTGDSYPSFVFKNIRAIPHDPRLMGAPMVYRGKGFSLSVNFTIAHPQGTLVIPSIGLDSATKLDCR